MCPKYRSFQCRTDVGWHDSHLKHEALLAESLAVAVKTEALDVKDLSNVIFDTTVQEKAITFPTEAKLKNRARVMLVKLAKKHGVTLRQGYPKVGKFALMKHQRYAVWTKSSCAGTKTVQTGAA